MYPDADGAFNVHPAAGPARRVRAARTLTFAGLALLITALPISAQVEDPPPPLPDAALEHYLEEHGLRDLLITHLLRRVRATEGAERTALAERLGALYVQMLDEATTPQQRREWEAHAIGLLESVPEAESLELRLTLAKARYLQAEETAERHRLRLAPPEERQEAETVLRAVTATLREMASTLNRRVEQLERREAAGRDDEAVQLREQLSEARRLRSLTMYYAGWSAYYSALLTGRPQFANEALNHFGWLLNASGRPANVERISADMLRYEHIARAAIGCALSESLRGRDGAALLWLHAVDSAPELPDNVRRQLPAHRIVVLVAAKRWADLQQTVSRLRQPVRDGPIDPLSTAQARLLAVLMLEALEDRDVQPQAHDVIRALADAALTDLITRGDARLVHDLVTRYGTGLLSGDGFIVQYVRGLHAYEKARTAHAQNENDQQPTSREEVANLYAAAGQMFDNAADSPDAATFPGEHASATMLGALCLYYSNRLERAADRFERAHQLGTSAIRSDRPIDPADAELHEGALWMAVVALDKAVEGGRVSLQDRLERLATLYLQTYPGGDRAAMLLLRLSNEGLVSREQAAEILLAIPASSPLYEAARQHAADLLYGIYRRARGSDRDFAALRFAEISDELLILDRARIHDETDEGQAAASRAVLRLRQVLDAVLGMSAPDVNRAELAIQHIQNIAARGGLEMRSFEDEVAFRRLQVALHRDLQADADRALAQLHTLGGRFADAADRLMYQRALTHYRAGQSPRTATEVVRHGLRVVGQFGAGPAAFSDPVVQSLYNTVAEAAAHIWQAQSDEEYRKIALQLDRAVIDHRNPPASILKRFAGLAEAAGENDSALEAWRMLMAGLAAGSDDWFEARYHSLRLLALSDRARAREVFAQFKTLYPSLGEEPWLSRFRQLERNLEASDTDALQSPARNGGVSQ